MDVPLIEQVKIQAKILIPLIKTLQSELGQERADAVMRRALGDFYRKARERWWRRQHGSDLGKRMAAMFEWFADDDALDFNVVKQTATASRSMSRDAGIPNFFMRWANPNPVSFWFAAPTSR